MSKIAATSNFCLDYWEEYFVNLPPMTEEHAKKVADAINAGFVGVNQYHQTYYTVVPDDYKLQKGFEL